MLRNTGMIGAALALAAAQPAFAGSAADALGPGSGRMGAFAGARLSLDLGGARRAPVRAGVMLTGTRTDVAADGSRRTELRDGLAFGFAGGRTAVTFAGRPVRELAPRRNASTAGTVAIVVGGLVLAGGIGFLILLHEAEKNSD